MEQMKERKVDIRTYIVTVAVIAVMALASIAYVRSTSYPDDQTDLYLNPPFGEASYVIGQYDATYYYAKNCSSGEYEFLSTNFTYVEQAAEGQLSDDGGKLFFMPGTFTSALYGNEVGRKAAITTLHNGTVYEGSGEGTVFKIADSSADGAFLDTNGMERVVGSNFYIYGNKANNPGTTQDGLYVYGGQQDVFFNIWIYSVTNNGLNVYGNVSASWEGGIHRFSNMFIYYADLHGVAVNYSNDDHFSDIYVQSSGGSGIYAWYNHRWFNIHSTYSGSYGFDFEGGGQYGEMLYADTSYSNGIYLLADANYLVNTYCYRNSVGVNNTYDAIHIGSDSDNNTIIGGRLNCGSSAGSYAGYYCKYGIHDTGTQNTFIGITTSNPITAGILTSSALTHAALCWNNTRYITEWLP